MATTQLDTDLARTLRDGPFPAALHLAIERRGMSLDALQQALFAHGIAVSLSTLSYWRRGRSRPERDTSLRAVTTLEQVLGLPDQSLLGLLGPRQPRGRWLNHPVAAVPLSRLWLEPDELGRIHNGLADDRLERLSVADTCVIDADRRVVKQKCRLMVRAVADRVAHCVVIYWAEERGDRRVEVIGSSFCRVGRIREDHASGFTVAELVLDRVLSHGELAVLEYELAVPRQDQPTDDFSRRFPQPVRDYTLTIVFDADAIPARCHGYRRTSITGPDRWAEELWPSSQAVQLVSLDLTPGVIGIRWEWE